MKKHLPLSVGINILVSLFLFACGGSPVIQTVNSPIPTETVVPQTSISVSTSTLTPLPTPTSTLIPSSTPIIHLSQPETPSYISLQLIQDCTMVDSTGTPIQPLRLFPVCDIWKISLIERPFSADLNTYLPYLDIQEAQFGANANWFYARIHPVDVVASQGDADLNYILEFDLNIDGLNDLLIASQNLSLNSVAWTTSTLHAWRFTDGTINTVFDQGVGIDPDMIWVRRTPTKDIEFAFKPTLLGGDTRFAWWVWAYQGVLDPAQFIPLNTLPETYQIDNTCSKGFNIPVTGLPNQCP
jgi:hypothetical protein